MIYLKNYYPFHRNNYRFYNNFHSHNLNSVNAFDDNLSQNFSVDISSSVDNPKILDSTYSEDDFLILLLILFLLLEHSDDYPLLISLVLLLLD